MSEVNRDLEKEIKEYYENPIEVEGLKLSPAMTIVKTSNDIDVITKALSAAQGEFKEVKKDSSANHTFTFAWASLVSIENATKEALVKQGICSIFQTEKDPDGKLYITYKIMKENQYLSASLPLLHESSKNDNQAMGKAISYNRRYLKYMMLDLAADDNDIDNGPERVKQPAYNQYKKG